MINSIIGAISVSLNGEFGDSFRNYVENDKQELENPCFFISCINPTHNLFLGNERRKRYFRKNQFCIQFFPEDKENPKTECNSVAERMEFCLEWIRAGGDLVQGTNMKYEVIDGVLNFFVNYDLFVYRDANPENMEELSENIHMKG